MLKLLCCQPNLVSTSIIFESPNFNFQFMNGPKISESCAGGNGTSHGPLTNFSNIFMRTNDINAANTSGQEMLYVYVFPSARECQKTG